MIPNYLIQLVSSNLSSKNINKLLSLFRSAIWSGVESASVRIDENVSKLD